MSPPPSSNGKARVLAQQPPAPAAPLHARLIGSRAAPARPSAPAQPVADLNRRQLRRIATGATEIEARLDLHGLTQQIAHQRLMTFLHASSRSGLKTVLVITGKGRRHHAADDSPGWHVERDIGILRHSVPRWLEEPPLRALVISYRSAAIRHGGDGAFYILLRRTSPGSSRGMHPS